MLAMLNAGEPSRFRTVAQAFCPAFDLCRFPTLYWQNKGEAICRRSASAWVVLVIRNPQSAFRNWYVMPVYQLTDALFFPDPAQANPRGLLAVGGDLRVERLLLAYRLGIFPWYGPGKPVLWWSPPKRCIVEPTRFHASRSLQRIVKQGRLLMNGSKQLLPARPAAPNPRRCHEPHPLKRAQVVVEAVRGPLDQSP